MAGKKLYRKRAHTGRHYSQGEGSALREIKVGEMIRCYPEELGGALDKFEEVEEAPQPQARTVPPADKP